MSQPHPMIPDVTVRPYRFDQNVRVLESHPWAVYAWPDSGTVTLDIDYDDELNREQAERLIAAISDQFRYLDEQNGGES